MFKHLYYSLGFFALLYEFWSIRNYDKERAVIKKILENSEELSNNTMYFTFCLLHVLYALWALAGVLTSQWLVFLALIILSFISSLSFLKNKQWNLIDSIISISLIAFAIINTYHLHIPLLERIIELFR